MNAPVQNLAQIAYELIHHHPSGDLAQYADNCDAGG